jgi:hypothetical protein
VGDLLVAANVGRGRRCGIGSIRMLRGWSAYFSYGTRTTAYRAVDNHVYERVRNFLRRRHKVPSRGTSRFQRKRSSASWGYSGYVMCNGGLVRESTVKPVGKPDARNPHVRFDERGWETLRPITLEGGARFRWAARKVWTVRLLPEPPCARCCDGIAEIFRAATQAVSRRELLSERTSIRLWLNLHPKADRRDQARKVRDKETHRGSRAGHYRKQR